MMRRSRRECTRSNDRDNSAQGAEYGLPPPYHPRVATAASAHRFDADVYGRIVSSGALDDQRVELLDGEIVDMSPNSPRHAAVIVRLTELLGGGAAMLRVQLPLQVASDSVPEPDIALVTERLSTDRHPTSALLVVEVAVSSLALDRGRKAELYGQAGVPAYWVADVPGECVELYSDLLPSGRYGAVRAYRGDEQLPLAVPGVSPFTVDAVLR
jgi:Uma2 family endonuclease